MRTPAASLVSVAAKTKQTMTRFFIFNCRLYQGCTKYLISKPRSKSLFCMRTPRLVEAQKIVQTSWFQRSVVNSEESFAFARERGILGRVCPHAANPSAPKGKLYSFHMGGTLASHPRASKAEPFMRVQFFSIAPYFFSCTKNKNTLCPRATILTVGLHAGVEPAA